jgi:hypothetical protein
MVAVFCAVACSATPPAAPPAQPETPRIASWLCSSSPRVVSLQALGVPADSRPIDLALSPEKVTVLLSPARIVAFSRNGFQVVDMIVGMAGDSWRAIDRDPFDGSLWVASEENVSLLRITETGQQKAVAGPRTTGPGGFRQIRVAPDAIYATPSGADSAVWRLSRAGKLLGQSFPWKEKEAVGGVEELVRADFWLAHDLQGNVVGFDRRNGQLYRADAGGGWTPLADGFPALTAVDVRTLRGQGVGTSWESWYFTNARNGFFFLPGGPVVLGSQSEGLHSRGSALLRVVDGKFETAIEDCAGSALLMVVSDSTGFAAVSASGVELYKSGERRILPSTVLLGGFSPGR